LRDARLLAVLQIAEARRLSLEELPQIVEARGLRSWSKLVQAEDVLVVQDFWLSWWDDLETRCHLLDVFMPGGRFAGYTKLLSYDGAVAANADIGYISVDLGNYVYGVALYSLRTFFGPGEYRQGNLARLNDESLGDILEAVMGLWWHIQKGSVRLFPGGPVVDSLRPTQVTTGMLEVYVFVMWHALHWTKSAVKVFTSGGVWTTSRRLARLML